MLALQNPAQQNAKNHARATSSLDSALHRLASGMKRAAAETAAAFFCTQAELVSDWDVTTISGMGTLHSTQKNIGEKFSMTCNLTVEKSQWDRMFTARESEELKLDALCELANCICGYILANAEFTDEFGYLTACVPSAGISRATAGTRTLRGSLRISDTRIHFAFILQQAQVIPVPDACLAPDTAVAA